MKTINDYWIKNISCKVDYLKKLYKYVFEEKVDNLREKRAIAMNRLELGVRIELSDN